MGSIVAKFGGSSVRDAEAMRRCVAIVANHPDINLVILSATWNTTNELEDITGEAARGHENETSKLVQSLKNKHVTLLKNLGLKRDMLEDLFRELETATRHVIEHKECNANMMDRFYAFGERLSSRIFAALLERELDRKVTLIDARDVLKTDSSFNLARPDCDAIKKCVAEKVSPWLDKAGLVVTQGFIGSSPDGQTTTLGREGSDYSATLLGEAMGAATVQIWTDVPGIATADPKLVAGTRIIPELTYDEASAMAGLGAKILFPKTLEPAKRKGIEVFVGSSLDASLGGTWIRPKTSQTAGPKVVCMYKRGTDHVVSIVGEELDRVVIDLPEIDQSEFSRSFMVEESDDWLAQLTMLHDKYLL